MSLPLSKPKPVTVPDFVRPIACTPHGPHGHDYSVARLLDEAGVDAILVGDSLGMVMQGTRMPCRSRSKR